MTVKLIETVQRFIGASTDTKPTGVPCGSTFWEYNTNIEHVTYDGTNWTPKNINSIIIPTTIDLQQAAGTYTLYTATGGTVYIESFTLTLPNVDCSDDVNITSISVVNDMPTVVTLISATQGAKANLTANASFSYSTPFALTVGKKINLIIAGGAADAATVCTVSCRYSVVTPAAYLA
jgi:hypothetical protein